MSDVSVQETLQCYICSIFVCILYFYHFENIKIMITNSLKLRVTSAVIK